MKMLSAAILAATLALSTIATSQAAPQPTPSSPNAPNCNVGIGVGLNVPPVFFTNAEKANPQAVKISARKPLVVMVMRGGGPAASAGMHRHDSIVSVDGKSVTGMTPSEVVAMITGGPIGSTVVIGIRRDGNHLSKTVTVARALICW